MIDYRYNTNCEFHDSPCDLDVTELENLCSPCSLMVNVKFACFYGKQPAKHTPEQDLAGNYHGRWLNNEFSTLDQARHYIRNYCGYSEFYDGDNPVLYLNLIPNKPYNISGIEVMIKVIR